MYSTIVILGTIVCSHPTPPHPIPLTPSYSTPSHLLHHTPPHPTPGPGPLEALAAGCVFIQPIFNPPHNKKTTTFLNGKPTSRELQSQVPYLHHFVGEPYVSHMTLFLYHMTLNWIPSSLSLTSSIPPSLHLSLPSFFPPSFLLSLLLPPSLLSSPRL